MSESIYRRKPEGDTISVLQGRSALLKSQTHIVTGKSAMVRDPAFIQITGKCNSCKGGPGMILPHIENTWDSVYRHKQTIKTGPILEQVIIECAGDYGLARKISATIRCFKEKDFEEVVDAFLLPGNEISANFYHKVKWGIGSSGKIENYRVATFNFNGTAEGHWICNFTAVSAGASLKNADIQVQVRSRSLKFKEAGSIDPEEKHDAFSLAQLIASDAQLNGDISKDAFNDDYLITSFKDYNEGIGLPNGKPAIKLFTGDYLRASSGFMGWGKTELPKDEVDKVTNQVYVTLGYVIDRVINDQILGSIKNGIGGDDKEKYSKLKIRFDKVLSKSKITPEMQSGDPLTVLLHGPGGFKGPRGNYKNWTPIGKNFEEKIPEPVSVLGDSTVLPWNILINRNVVTQAYKDSIKEKEAKSDSVALQVQKEETVNLNDFLDKIFRSISDALGGFINLTLVEDPKNQNYLLVIDQNYGVSVPIPVVVFNPIDGDGSTRQCVVESNVGSAEYTSTMYMGMSKRGDPATKLRDCNSKMLPAREFAYNTALFNARKLVDAPGHLAKNAYNPTDIQALKSIISSMYHNRPEAEKDEAIHFPGMQITIDLDGVWGFIPGNAISSTQLPKSWRRKNVYFMVVNVTHTFQNNDWQTTLRGIMAYYESLQPVNL